MTRTHQAAVYARSATGPGPAGSTTLERQVEACRRYGYVHSLTVDSDLIVADITPGDVDPAERPALSQLLRAAEQGRFSVLVVYSPDRLTREPRVFLTLHQQFREHDVDIRFALLDVEASDSPASRLAIGTKADAHERRTQLRRSSEFEACRGRMQPNEPNEPIV